MHKLLERQLRRHVGDASGVPEALRPFLAAVEEAYRQSDDDRAMLEHSLETVSSELVDRFRQIRQAVSVLEATLESSTDAIVVVSDDDRMVHMNAKFVELWRLPRDLQESRDAVAATRFGAEQLREPGEFLRRVKELRTDADSEGFDVLHFRDGRIVERYSLPHRVAGRTIGRVWSFRDVTERRRLEEQLRQSQKMEAVGQLAGGIAHDFNNLLAVIRSHAELLVDAVDANTDEGLDVSEIIMATDRASKLIRQLLTFSRKGIVQRTTLDLGAIVAGMRPMLRRLISESIEMIVADRAAPLVVRADASQMEQVLVNLVVNARDAMTAGGRIEIATRAVQLDPESPEVRSGEAAAGRYAVLSVVDTGHGIAPETRERIFEPFFTTKDAGKGTGLGLATVYGIIAQSGGFIRVESQVGAGTRFEVFLPEVPPEHAGAPVGVHDGAARAEPAPRPSATILLAEDEDAVREPIKRILAARGYRVLTASDGIDAVRVADQHAGPIDLLVTDVVMPRMGGAELADRLRATRPEMGVLFMSGYDGDGTHHVGPMIEKPFANRDLVKAVRMALEARTAER